MRKLLWLLLLGTAAGQIKIDTTSPFIWRNNDVGVYTHFVRPVRLHDLTVAIARSEGFYVKGSLAQRCHNPGNLRLVHAPGQTGTYHGYAVFFDDAAGWNALRAQIIRILSGASKYYKSDTNFQQLGARYAADGDRWTATVCRILKVDPATRLMDYIES